MAKKTASKQKSSRTLNRTTGKTAATKKKSPNRKKASGAPFSEQDPKRRLGNFSTTGEHARQGGRTSGIVGQTKQRNKTDKRS